MIILRKYYVAVCSYRCRRNLILCQVGVTIAEVPAGNINWTAGCIVQLNPVFRVRILMRQNLIYNNITPFWPIVTIAGCAAKVCACRPAIFF